MDFGGKYHGIQTIHSNYNDTNGSTIGATRLVYYFIKLELYITLGQLGLWSLFLLGQYIKTRPLYPIVGVRLFVRLSIRFSVGWFCTTPTWSNFFFNYMDTFVQYK